MDFMSTTQLLGNLGEFFGAIAVVATLGYLAVQVRHSNRSTISATTLEIVKLANEINHRLSTDADMERLFVDACNEPEHLSEKDAVAGALIIRNYMNIWFAGHVIHKSGGIAQEIWRSMDDSFGGVASTPGGKKFFSENADSFDPEFVALASRPYTTSVSGFAFATAKANDNETATP